MPRKYTIYRPAREHVGRHALFILADVHAPQNLFQEISIQRIFRLGENLGMVICDIRADRARSNKDD